MVARATRASRGATTSRSTPAWKAPCARRSRAVVARLAGSLVEEKSASVVWHYRRVLPELASTHLGEVRAILAPLAERYDLRVTPGAKSLEVRSARVSKGAVTARLAAEMPGAVVIAAGDDTTDEDMFRALPDEAVTVKVGQGVSAARYRVDGVRALRELIEGFVRLGDLGGTLDGEARTAAPPTPRASTTG